MRHGNHCMHCGGPMALLNNRCNNNECQTEVTTMPVWPWSRCRGGDRSIIAFILTNRQLARMLWPLAIGAILFLIGFFAASSRMQLIGLILAIGWFLGRLTFQFIRKAELDMIMRENERQAVTSRLGNRANLTPDEKDELDEAMDKVRAVNWRHRRNKLARINVYLTTVLLVSIVVMSWGPGNIFPWSVKNWMLKTYEEVKNAPLTQSFILDTKNNLEWDEHKIIFLHNKLRHERWLTEEQFQSLLKLPRFNPDAAMDELKIVKFKETQLYNHLHNSFILATPKAEEKPIYEVGEKGYFQKVREKFWITLSWINLLLAISLTIFSGIIITTFIGQMAFIASDELRDQIKLRLERKEPVEKKETGAEEKPQAQVTKPGKTIKEWINHIFHIAVISGVLDWFFEKFIDKKISH